MKEFSVPVGLDAKVKVDLVVVGSVAVSEKGEALPTRLHHLTSPALNTGILKILLIITITDDQLVKTFACSCISGALWCFIITVD